MKLKNPFKGDTRLLFIDNFGCFSCGRSDRGIEAHHIVGRVSRSPLNLAPICPLCHSRINHNEFEERDLFNKVWKYLKKEGYKPTFEDREFLEKNQRLTINNNGSLHSWLYGHRDSSATKSVAQ